MTDALTAPGPTRASPRTDAYAGFFQSDLAQSDPALMLTITEELHRQQTQIELIASENIVSRAVLQAQGSVLTNKYAEGYPGKRYYGGCEYRRRLSRAAGALIVPNRFLAAEATPMCSPTPALAGQSGRVLPGLAKAR